MRHSERIRQLIARGAGLPTVALALLVMPVFASGATAGETVSDPPRERSGIASAVPQASGDRNYRLNQGDVLEFSVRGFPDLRQRAIVELDGEVSLPLAGRVRVVGMTLAEAQSVIKKLATPRPLQQRLPDGRDGYVALAMDDVLVTIAEYRPIYVMGDIGKPGEIAYRPGMTVHHAIALGGGFDIMRYRLVNPFMESADLKGTHEVLWTDVARVKARLNRVDTELAGKSELDPGVVAGIPLDRTYLDEIIRTEAETLARRLDDHAKEERHLRGLIAQNMAKVDTLTKQLDTEMKGMKADSGELEQVQEFHRRGSLPLMRMMEVRRIQLANATRVLQTRVQLDQAERDLAEARRSVERHANAYRTGLLAERQEQSATLKGLMAKLTANTEKLEHTSVLKSRLVRGPGAKVAIRIHRSLLDHKESLDGTEDANLYPGDTVEITLESSHDLRAGAARPPGGASATPQSDARPQDQQRRSAARPAPLHR